MSLLYRSFLKLTISLLAFYLGFAIVACDRKTVSTHSNCRRISKPCLDGPKILSLQTSRGTILVRLDGENAPFTAGNFLDLSQRGVYNGTVFHRVVRSPLPFVVQGGDPLSANPNNPPNLYGTGNYIDKTTGEVRYIPLELKMKGSNKFVYGRELLTPGVSGYPVLRHDRGAIAMARASDPNSASAQFYIALEALPELDGRYAVFGRVIRGMEIVDQLQQGDKLFKVESYPSK